jgi:hypothetical protein
MAPLEGVPVGSSRDLTIVGMHNDTGNLHFANVMPADDLGPGQAYLCVLSNDEIRSLVQGDDQRIIPIRLSGRRPLAGPIAGWPRPTPSRPTTDRCCRMVVGGSRMRSVAARASGIMACA